MSREGRKGGEEKMFLTSLPSRPSRDTRNLRLNSS